MKRILTSLVLLAAMAVASVSCLKEAQIEAPQSDAVQVEVTVSNPGAFGTATKAVQTEWQDGEQVMLFLNNDWANGPQLTLTYDAVSGSWSSQSNASFLSQPYIGTYVAVHHYGDMAYENGAFTNYKGGQIFCSEELPYLVTKEAGKIIFKAEVVLAIYDNQHQITIAGEDLVPADWKLAILNGDKQDFSKAIVEFALGAEGLSNANAVGVPAIANADGMAFFPQIVAAGAAPEEEVEEEAVYDDGIYTFVLTNTDGAVYMKTVRKAPGAIYYTSAIKMNFPEGWQRVIKPFEIEDSYLGRIIYDGQEHDATVEFEAFAAYLEANADYVEVSGETKATNVRPGEGYVVTLTCKNNAVFADGSASQDLDWDIAPAEIDVPIFTLNYTYTGSEIDVFNSSVGYDASIMRVEGVTKATDVCTDPYCFQIYLTTPNYYFLIDEAKYTFAEYAWYITPAPQGNTWLWNCNSDSYKAFGSYEGIKTPVSLTYNEKTLNWAATITPAGTSQPKGYAVSNYAHPVNRGGSFNVVQVNATNGILWSATPFVYTLTTEDYTDPISSIVVRACNCDEVTITVTPSEGTPVSKKFSDTAFPTSDTCVLTLDPSVSGKITIVMKSRTYDDSIISTSEAVHISQIKIN